MNQIQWNEGMPTIDVSSMGDPIKILFVDAKRESFAIVRWHNPGDWYFETMPGRGPFEPTHWVQIRVPREDAK